MEEWDTSLVVQGVCVVCVWVECNKNWQRYQPPWNGRRVVSPSSKGKWQGKGQRCIRRFEREETCQYGCGVAYPFVIYCLLMQLSCCLRMIDWLGMIRGCSVRSPDDDPGWEWSFPFSFPSSSHSIEYPKRSIHTWPRPLITSSLEWGRPSLEPGPARVQVASLFPFSSPYRFLAQTRNNRGPTVECEKCEKWDAHTKNRLAVK